MLIMNINLKYLKFIIILYLSAYLNIYSAPAPNHSLAKSIYQTSQRFYPEVGHNGAVATQEANATKVGLDILKQGGNAIDAAVAIGYTLAVTLPRAGNIGGGGFMTIWLNKEQKAYVINYRETAPKNINIKEINQIYNTDKNKFIYSYKSSGVPGTVAGLNLAAQKFGIIGKKDFPKLIKPAIALAQNGFPMDYYFLNNFKNAKNILSKDPESKKIFLNQIDKSFIGKKFIQSQLADTLKLIAKNKNNGFYQGKTADLITSAMTDKNFGGYISKNDLKNYKAKLSEPIIINYNNYKIIAPPPPSGGIILAEQLNILSALDTKDLDLPNNSAKYFHYLTEIMNLSYIDRNYTLGDPNFINLNLEKLLSKKYTNNLAKKIDPDTHTPAIDKSSWHEGQNTTHFVVIDKDLNVVSNTYTLNGEYGANKIIPGAGFFLNNELDDFAIDEKPNLYGLMQGKNNTIAANKQPISSMTPVIILDKNNIPVFATGSPGGSHIITSVFQIILNIINYKNDIATAVAAPRIHSQLSPDILFYEDGISIDTVEKLNKMGHVTQKEIAMGSAQSIYYDNANKLFMSYADPRRAGALAMAY